MKPIFDEASPEERPTPLIDDKGQFLLDLEGYEGPIDALLDLARQQKVDLTRISILALADQYLEFVARARSLRLELAADYLVMAAWLCYLKSRLLLPEPEESEEPSGAEMAAALRFQLQRLEAMRQAGQSLMRLPRLGVEVLPCGDPARPEIVTRTQWSATLYELLRAYAQVRRPEQAATLRIDPSELDTVDDAITRLSRLLGPMPGWRSLMAFLPEGLGGGLALRSALASTLAATLELGRQGKIEIRQDGNFQPIYIQARKAPPEGALSEASQEISAEGGDGESDAPPEGDT